MSETKHYNGLTDEEVLNSRQKNGVNELTPPPRESLWKLFWEKFNDPVIRILLVAALLSLVISFVEKHFAETIGIFFAIFLATGVAFWFEKDANQRFELLNQVTDDVMVKVRRNGRVVEVLRKEIVVGDIVILETGEEIPADGLLIDSMSLQVDESCLTGEPIIDKTINKDEFDEEATYPSNYVLRGTKVMNGHATMEVDKVGDHTDYGKVARKATEISNEKTPLNIQLEGLAKLIGVIGFSISFLTFGILIFRDIFLGNIEHTVIQISTLSAVLLGFFIASASIWLPIVEDGISLYYKKEYKLPKVLQNAWYIWLLLGLLSTFLIISLGHFIWGIDITSPQNWISFSVASAVLQHFMVSVTLIVVSVPEGLPMSVTLSLALSMRRMLQTNNLVRKMHACETMGAATVICTDKTGTLTQNRMSVNKVHFNALKEGIPDNETLASIVDLSIAVNTTAYLDTSDINNILPVGNPTETALLRWLYDRDIDYTTLRKENPVIEQIPFSTERKFMATLIRHNQCTYLFIKGAPEVIFSKCKDVSTTEGSISVIEMREQFEHLILGYQNQAMRTLGFAYKEIQNEEANSHIDQHIENGFSFLGFAAITDPVREDVPAAVSECLGAGIKIKIVTGDTTATAKEIGRQIGIWKETDTDQQIITGSEFESLTDEEAYERAHQLKIMCRARPTDKQRLVQLLQKRGEVVAVTGDGTNDAPALNHAQVGLSMGTGTSVAKEASDITLLDDSFASIVTAVLWGRSLYSNIQRFIMFQLTINVAALLIVLIGSLMGEELPLTVTQMLWVNLIMDTFAAGALASLPPDHKVMKERPRKNSDFILTSSTRMHIALTSLLFVGILLALIFHFTEPNGEISRYNLSCFFTVFVMLQFWNMFNAKAYRTNRSAFHNLKESKSFMFIAVLILIGQVIIVTFGGDVFRTTPISLFDWVRIISYTSLVLLIGEVVRFIKNKRQA